MSDPLCQVRCKQFRHNNLSLDGSSESSLTPRQQPPHKRKGNAASHTSLPSTHSRRQLRLGTLRAVCHMEVHGFLSDGLPRLDSESPALLGELPK
eukprot:6462840-Amphidinium_carterae.1